MPGARRRGYAENSITKDTVEKNFDDLKSDLDMKRLRIHSNAAMEGRIFIQFVALILTTYLKGIMDLYQVTM